MSLDDRWITSNWVSIRDTFFCKDLEIIYICCSVPRYKASRISDRYE